MQALSVADLALVMWLCETVSPQQVFTRPCPLQQPILLSLIQQLSSDLNTMLPDSKKLDIKIKLVRRQLTKVREPWVILIHFSPACFHETIIEAIISSVYLFPEYIL